MIDNFGEDIESSLFRDDNLSPKKGESGESSENNKAENEFRNKRSDFLQEARIFNAHYLLIVFDVVEQEYYPVLVNDNESFAGRIIEYNNANQQKLIEVIDVLTGETMEIE